MGSSLGWGQVAEREQGGGVQVLFGPPGVQLGLVCYGIPSYGCGGVLTPHVSEDIKVMHAT